MPPLRRVLTYAGLLVLSAAAVGAAASAASSRSVAVVRPVIGPATTVPVQAKAGKRLAVAFKVMRSDNRKPLTTGTMICDPSTAGKMIAHAESFRAGVARLSFVVPATATQVRVKVTIKAGTQSATRITNIRVAQVPKPAASVGDVSVAEGNAGTTTMSVPVTLSAPSTLPVSVSYSTTDGTAVAPGDYTTASGTLAFKAGETTKSITVSVVGETAVESDETLTVTISSPVNATIAKATATGTITNDDVAPKTGHYAGTTSQGKAIGFDVSADLKTVSGLGFVSDLTCAEVPVILRNLTLPMPAAALGADWSFSTSVSESYAEGSISASVSGKLAVPGSATGTAQVNFAINTDAGTVHCSSGALTWNAA